MNCGLYEIRNTGNGVTYVGSSVAIRKRWAEHRKMLLKGKHHSIYLQRAWDKHGEASFEFNVLAVLEPEECKATEGRLLAARLRDGEFGYNISKDPDSPMRGLKHKPETIEKMKRDRIGNKSRTGTPSHWAGKKMPDGTGAKLAARVHTPEWRQKMSEAAKRRIKRDGTWNKGVPATDKQKVHLRAIGISGAKARWNKE